MHRMKTKQRDRKLPFFSLISKLICMIQVLGKEV